MVILLDVIMPVYPSSSFQYVDDLAGFLILLAVIFLVNLALAAILLKLAPRFNFKKNTKTLLAAVAGLTVVAFVLEAVFTALSFLTYFLSFFMLAGIYYWLFRRLGLKWKRALAYGIAFGILTNPLMADLIIYSIRWP
jgi:peptidoglycan/LPS O-acetylase OafA/YrhL